MKKPIITTLACILVMISLVNAQVKRTSFSETKAAGIHCIYGMSVDMEKGDTSKYIYMGFQNNEYTSIIDTRSIFLTLGQDSSEVFEFVKDLKMAFAEMGNKSNMSWDRDNYSIQLWSHFKTLQLFESPKEGKGYTSLSKNKVESLIIWFQSIGFGNQ